MPHSAARAFAPNLVLGSAVCLAGTAAGLWLPAGLALFLAGIAVCRICWLEDNIHEDLLRADRIPAGYRACRSRRRTFLGGGDAAPEDPVALAGLLRIQSLAWATFAWGTATGALLAPGLNGTALFAALTLALALRAADYFAIAQTLVAAGYPIPRRLLAGDGPLRQLAVNPRSRD